MEAKFYKTLKNGEVICGLCRHFCKIENGKKGFCNVRKNENGTLEALNYGKLIAVNIDPIGKKPIYHFLPQSSTLSIATVGCNFRCLFCQNHSISQISEDNDFIEGAKFSPEDVVMLALKNSCDSISYTYTEPTIFFEFMYDTAKLAHKKGLKNIFVTNGYIAEKPLKKLAPFIDAANVDLKAFNNNFYEQYCFSKLEEVKKSLKIFKESSIFVEITTLIIPTLNDDIGEIKKLTRFLVDELGKNTPWHISSFHPTYKINNIESTPLETLKKIEQEGKKSGLNYIYIGNVANSEKSFCYNCKKILIEREGFFVQNVFIKNNYECPYCKTYIPFKLK